jgi:hypothetical protein
VSTLEQDDMSSGQSASDVTGGDHLHRAYGLVFRSDVPLLLVPRIEVSEGQPIDVVVQRGSLPRVAPPPACGSVVCWSKGQDAGFQVPTVGEFRATAGQEIVYDLNEGADVGRVPAYVIGVSMALILHQRGFLVLHGSAVEHDGRCFAFVAPKYHGKSTLSAALQARGCKLVTDDLIPVRIDESGLPTVTPAYPFSKVWPDAFAAIGEDADKSPRFLEGFDKRLRVVGEEGMAQEPVPLMRVYVLEWSDKLDVDRLPRAEAFQQTVTHTHHHVLPLISETSRGQIDHFQALGSVLRHTTVSRLRRPRNLDGLDEVCDLLLDDFDRD